MTTATTTTNPFMSRKFLLTVLFTIVAVANGPLNLGLSWENLMALAVMYGIYNVANVVKAIGE